MAAQTSKDYVGTWDSFIEIYREEDFESLCPGIIASLVHVVPSMAIRCSVYESLRSSWLSRRPNDSPVAVDLACGTLASLAASAATHPIDVVRRRMQIEGDHDCVGSKGGNLIRKLGEIVRKEGLGGLYRGFQSHCLKVVSGLGITFGACEIINLPIAILYISYLVRSGEKNLYMVAKDAILSDPILKARAYAHQKEFVCYDEPEDGWMLDYRPLNVREMNRSY